MDFIDFVGIAIAVALGVALAPYIFRILLGLGGLLVAGVIIIVFLLFWGDYPEVVQYLFLFVGCLIAAAIFFVVAGALLSFFDKRGLGHGPDEVWAENDEGKRSDLEEGN